MSTKIRNRTKLMFDQVDDKGNPLPSVRSRTKQSFSEQVNINSIIKKIAKTGLVPQKSGAYYGDFSSGLSYQETLQKIQNADEAFIALPSEVRTRFNNSPAELLDFLSSSSNLDEAYTLGLIERPSALASTGDAKIVPADAGTPPPTAGKT